VLARTVRAANPGVSPEDRRGIVERERRIIDSQRRAIATEQGRLIEQRKELNRTASGRSSEFNQRRILNERMDALQRAAGMGLSSRAGRLSQSDRRAAARRLGEASDLAAAGNVEAARAIRTEVEGTIAAKERQQRLDRQITRENEKGSRALVSLERQRQSSITQESKATQSVEVQRRQIAALAGRGTTGSDFERARAAAERLPQLQQAGNFDEFNRTLAEATTYSRFVRDALSDRDRLIKNGNKYEKGIAGINEKILAGKRITLQEAGRLEAFYRQAGGVPRQPALPPAAPGSAAFTPAPGVGARLGLRGTESVIGGVAGPRVIERLGGARTEAEALQALPEKAKNAGKKAGQQAGQSFAKAFAQATPLGVSDKLLNEISGFFKKLPETLGKSLSTKGGTGSAQSAQTFKKAFAQATDFETPGSLLTDLGKVFGRLPTIVGNAAKANKTHEESLKKTASAVEQLSLKTEILENLNAGVYDDSDLEKLINNFYESERAASAYLEKLSSTYKLEDERRKANERGASKSEQRLDRENSQMLAIEKRQRKLAELQAAGVTGPALERAQSLVNRLPELAAKGAGGAREFTRIDRQAAQALGFATPKRGAGAGGGKAKTPEQIARNFARELISAQEAEQNLIGLSRKNVDASSQLVSIQDAINQAKKLGTSISEKDLEILKDQVATARDFVRVEKSRLANAKKGSNLKALKAASEGRLPSIKRDTLTSNLIELGRADTAAKVFRGGRSGEQALSDAIKAFNAATGPQPRSALLAPGSTGGLRTTTQKGVPIGAGAAAEAGEAGQNVVDTFANKLSAGAGKALSSGMKLGMASIRGIKDALDMRSPSRVMIEIALNVINTYVATLNAAIPQVEAVSKKLADASAQAMQGPASVEFGGLPKNAVKAITPKTSSSYIDAAATTLLNLGINRSKLGNLSDTAMFEMARGIVTQKGAYPLIENIPGIDDRALSNERAMGRAGEQTQIAKKALLDFYGINEKGLPEARAGVTGSTEAAAANVAAAEQEARQLGQAISELVTGFNSLKGFVQAAADMAQGVKTTSATKVSSDPAIQAAIEKAAQIDAENAARARERAAIAAEFAPSIQAAQVVDKAAAKKAVRDSFTQAAFAPSIQAAKVADKAAADRAIRDSFAQARAQAEADARAVASASSQAVEEASTVPIDQGEAEVRTAIQRLFDRLSGAVNRAFGGGSGGGRPPGGPVPPTGPNPGDFEGRVDGARGNAQKLLGLADLANLSSASNKQLQLFSAALTETRDGLKTTDAAFNKLNKVINRTDDILARRDPNADFLTRRFGERGGQAVGEGLIGGAFPLLFGQGAGAAAGGGLGGFLGGLAGGTLGFGLSLAGTAIGSQADLLAQAAQDTGNTLRELSSDVSGAFEKIRDSGLLASREQEKLVAGLLEVGNKTAAYSIIQEELNSKLGATGAARLKEAADAGDRFNRALAALGSEMQLFIAGPLTAFLNALAQSLEKGNKDKTRLTTAAEGLGKLPSGKREELLNAFAAANISAGADPRKNKVKVGSLPLLGNYSVAPGGGSESTGDMLQRLTSNLSPEQVSKIVFGFAPAKPPTEQERRQAEIRSAESNLAGTQRQLDVFNKKNEGLDLAKGFKQQATAAKREQEDLDRQAFELRRDYERQIEDIRRGIEDRISQIRQENAQKELEILVKQGQIREEQFKNAAVALRGSLAGDELAQELADAVTTYLGAQLSAENQLQQVRKRFEIEVRNQQVEAEKYKLEVGRTLSRLNTDTAERVAEINRGVRRRNEDAAMNEFKLQKESAKLRAMVIGQELKVMLAKQQQFLAEAQTQYDKSPTPGTQKVVEFEQRMLTFMQNAVEGSAQNIKDIEAVKAPQLAREIAAPTTRSVSLAGVERGLAQGDALAKQALKLEESLIEIAKTGNAQAFTEKMSEIVRAPQEALDKSLSNARRALGEASDDFSFAVSEISASYRTLVGNLSSNKEIKITKEILGLVAAAEISSLELLRLRPTVQFYAGAFDQLADSVKQSRDGIAELLRPAKAYDAILEQINSRGGLGVNPEEEQELLRAAKALDNINLKLKVLEGLRDIASSWTDSFIQLNKELLKGGNLLESVQRFAESVADKTLDVILEFTLRPIQERLFQNLANFIGIEKEKNPLLLPLEQTRDTVRDFYDAAKVYFGEQSKKASGPSAQTAPAPFRAPTPERAPLPPGARSNALTGQFTGVGGPDLPASMTQSRVQQALKLSDEEIAAAVNTAIGEYGGRDPLGRTDVFANILSRSRSGQYPRNLVDVVTQSGQYAPNFGLSRAQVTDPNRYGRQMFEQAKAELLNEQLLQQSIKDVNGRMFFKGVSQYPNMMQGDFLRAQGQNFFHGPGSQPGLNPAITSNLLSEIRGASAPVTAEATIDNTALLQQYESALSEATAAMLKFREAAGLGADAATKGAQATQLSTDTLAKSATQFQTIVGTGLQAITSVAMGIGGAQMIRKGGAYNTLMGAASIFGSIGSIAGMFAGPKFDAGTTKLGAGGGVVGGMGTLGPNFGLKARALGGPVFQGNEYLVGEQGPEVIRMGANGTVIPTDELYVPGLDDKGSSSAPPVGRYARRSNASSDMADGDSEGSSYGDTYQRGSSSTTYVGNYGRAVPYQRSETTREIDRLERVTSNPSELPPIKYETTRVNEYDFVTPDQLEASNARTAKIARNQTIRELADSMKTRKRLGL